MINKSLLIREYIDSKGENHFRSWLERMPTAVSARIQARLFRLQQGNLGDFKPVGHSVYEIRFLFGPGYRVYFGFEGRKIIILLAGGDKRTQRRDIMKARQCWLDYQSRRRYGS